MERRLKAGSFDAGRVTALSAGGIALHLVLRCATAAPQLLYLLPLYAVLLLGGLPLALDLAGKLWARDFGADLLAGISIATSVLLSEYLVGRNRRSDARRWHCARTARDAARVR
jgi:cation transport ATPase